MKYLKLITLLSINHKDNFIAEHTALPDNLIKNAKGQEILLQTMPQLQPIAEFDDPVIPKTSRAFFDKHRGYFQTEYLILQVNSTTAAIIF